MFKIDSIEFKVNSHDRELKTIRKDGISESDVRRIFQEDLKLFHNKNANDFKDQIRR